MPADLSDKQRRFVDEYLIDMNGKQAAIRAGYSPDAAAAQASRLLTYANVSEALRQGRDELAKKAGVTQEWVIDRLKLVAEKCIDDEFNPAGANGALNLLGKHLGLFTDKIEVSMDESLSSRLNAASKRVSGS